jgi:hypothetical protein
MHRALVGAVGFVVVGSCLGAPRAAADDQFCASTPSTQNCFFKAPSGYTSCELDFDNKVYCQTFQPNQSVEMNADGVLKVCNNRPDGCVGNPPTPERSLDYGKTATRGLFTCQSAPSGVTCTVPSGKGFSISSAGITPVG